MNIEKMMTQNLLPDSLSWCRKTIVRLIVSLGLLAFALFTAPLAAQAQTQTMAGTLDNFDVLNNTGQETHGFEIQVEGITSADIYRIFGNWGAAGNVIRYGQGIAIDYPGGVYIRWMSPWDPATQSFTLATPIPPSMTSVPGESCWTLGMGNAYYTAGCEHFGISAYKNPTKTTYRWLVADPQNPGNLIPSGTAVSLPAPVWTVTPAAVPGNPPVVAAEIVAPQAEQVQQFGDAQWVKVYKTEHPNEVQLEELVGDNQAIVPENPAQVEVSWNLIQQDPQVGKQKRKGRQVNQGNLGIGNHAVVRRYEYYKYTGAYDPITHEAICGGDGTCNTPLDGELGDAIGAANAAANIVAPSLTVSSIGGGSIASSDRAISCGNKCSAFYNGGTAVTLTANPGNNAFAGWGGACGGKQLSCTVIVNDELNVTATFVPQYNLSVAHSGSGSVASNPGIIDCGKTCSAKVEQGATVTLTATPAVGQHFVNWTGACSGTAPTCTVTMNQDTKVQANFAK